MVAVLTATMTPRMKGFGRVEVQNRASYTLRLWDGCKMRNENGREAETTAEQPCERSNQITQKSDSDPSQFVLALSFKCPHDSLT